MPERGYAVICLKTTGLCPYQRDRVVEVAVVYVVPTPSFLARAVVKLPDYTGPEEHLDHLALLDLCLLGPVLSPREALEFRFLAEFSGITVPRTVRSCIAGTSRISFAWPGRTVPCASRIPTI
jgi:hypothetical protein